MYADDTVVIVESQEQLQSLINVWVTENENGGCYFSSTKSFTMLVSNSS